ncbi:MAG: hypothetical protein Q4G70_12730 [Pseudomonadota bacterium]|nr:hypothetical protein [Pseudomonadota bacterium]
MNTKAQTSSGGHKQNLKPDMPDDNIPLGANCDLIEDGDGQGQIMLSGAQMGSASYDEAAGAWVSASGHRIQKYEMGGCTLLAISAPGDAQSTIYVRNWSDGQLDISLNDQPQEPTAPTAQPSRVTSRADNSGRYKWRKTLVSATYSRAASACQTSARGQKHHQCLRTINA